MGYQSWGQGVQVEVAHAIGAYHHRSILLIEGLHNLLEGLGRGIEVVGIELYGEASATVVVDGYIPTAADTQVMPVGDDMDQTLVMQAV